MPPERYASEGWVERLTTSVEELKKIVTDLRITVAQIVTKEDDFNQLKSDVQMLMDERQQAIGKRALLVPLFMIVGGIFEGCAEWLFHFFRHGGK